MKVKEKTTIRKWIDRFLLAALVAYVIGAVLSLAFVAVVLL